MIMGWGGGCGLLSLQCKKKKRQSIELFKNKKVF